MRYENDIIKVVNYIEKNLQNDLYVEELTSNIGYSYYHFSRVFYSATGEKLGDYIRRRRLAEASIRLIETNDSILMIALDYQFQSQEAFTRSFKKVFGITPKEYRMNGVKSISNTKFELNKDRLNHRFYKIDLKPDIVKITEDKYLIGLEKSFTIRENIIPNIWDIFLSRFKEIKDSINENILYGMTIANFDIDFAKFNENTKSKHFVGVEVKRYSEPPLGMKVEKINKGYYAVFRYKGSIKNIRNTYEYIWGTWAKNLKYNLRKDHQIEVYDQEFYDYDDERNIIKIYMPIDIEE
ncbi:AraC family transcriptional regulator [Senegalia massiliensis]|uniref:AraC family transcriptional regulator n=1 Tax=Senegalia massiliensis TaxID=1720316 RepID=UPI0010304EF4|nr:AraC family transcriptional regulator [Senegalia massiliensis]